MEQDDPIRTFPIRDIDDPKRTIARTDTELPTVIKSKIESALPHRPCERNERDDSICKKFRQDTAEPKREKLRTEIDDPK
jgi:hypothetical protein